jgi:hypothetical protein
VPILTLRGRTLKLKTRVTNRSTRPIPHQNSSGRRLVRLGAQLCAADRRLIELNHARAFLPRSIQPGETVDVAIDVPAPAEPGTYQLKFDLACEGIDWFENCGSPVTYKPLRVL